MPCVEVRTSEGFEVRWTGGELHQGQCSDCGWLIGYVTWWCGNQEAVKAFGTSIPGRRGCRYWKAPKRRKGGRKR